MSRLRLTEVARDLSGVQQRAHGDRGATQERASAWLDRLMTLLRLPEAQRRDIRDELEDHLEGRVRDLILTGLSEENAAAAAIDELGDTAVLAHRLREAGRTSRRRRIMSMGFIAAGVAVLTLGAVVMSQGQPEHPVPVSVFDPQYGAGTKNASFDSARVASDGEVSWATFFKNAGEAAGLPVMVQWKHLLALSTPLDADSQMNISFPKVGIPAALLHINQEQGVMEEPKLDWRVVQGTLVFSTTEYFDRLETTLVTYDLSSIPNIEIGGEAGTMEQIRALIHAMVHPTLWVDNGGTMATMMAVETKLFVKAPKRVHASIEWLLGELQSKRQGRAAAGADGGAAALRDLAMMVPGSDPLATGTEEVRATLYVRNGQVVYAVTTPDGTVQEVAGDRIELTGNGFTVRGGGLINADPRRAPGAGNPGAGGREPGALLLEPGKEQAVSMVPLQNIAAESAMETIQAAMPKLLMDQRTNSLVIRGTPTQLAAIETLLSKVDVPAAPAGGVDPAGVQGNGAPVGPVGPAR